MVNLTTLEIQISKFFRDLIDSEHPDRIITVERKGTAVVRTLIEELPKDYLLPIKWSQIESDEAIPLLSIEPNHLANEKILLFDEMVHLGQSMQRTIKKLIEKGAQRGNIVTAAFVVHEDCPTECRPDRFFRTQLDAESYNDSRRQIIQMLQRHGSLLLDTEHVEIPVNVHCSIREFFEAISSCGESVAFSSADNRINLTVLNPEIDESALKAILPEETIHSGVVKKCRVVQREGNEFAIIPIFYPCVPTEVSLEWKETLPEFLKQYVDSSRGIFYSIGLLASLEVLRSVCITIARLGTEKVTILTPQISSSGSGEEKHATASLDHLCALFPNLNVKELREYISNILLDIQKPASILRKKIWPAPRLLTPSEDELHSFALLLIQESLETLQRIEDYETSTWIDLKKKQEPKGLSYAEIMDLAENLGISKPLASAAIDILIDDACLLTRVEEAICPDGVTRSLRTFEPDGEAVASAIRRFTAVAGIAGRKVS